MNRLMVTPLAALLLTLPSYAQSSGSANIATAQPNPPWKSKLCKGKEAQRCGIRVEFNPPVKDALVLPNKVTVDVPQELGKVAKVVVSSYPRGTGLGDIPEQEFAQMRHSQNIGSYARFRGAIKKCTDQGSLQVLVYFKGFQHNPIWPYAMAVECRESEHLRVKRRSEN